MCGFAGYTIRKQGARPVTQTDLERMQATLVHRGPDGKSIWINKEQNLGFCFCRLSIIDLSARAMQPMHSADGTLHIVFNGEIYNYRQLRTILETTYRCTFTTTSDTEVLLHAYQMWGIGCLEKLDGMFAFALYDSAEKKLFLVRDRFGVKPIYFTTQGGFFAFASELKALQTLPWVTSSICPRGLAHYLSLLVTPAPYTMLEGIYKLPAGYYACLNVATDTLQFTRWYDPRTSMASRSNEKTALSEAAAVSDISELLLAATKKRMVADVPVGAFLSGGIDSSLNVALMSQFASNINTFNVRFAGAPSHDESQWATMVAKQFGTNHHQLTIDEKDAYHFYPNMVTQLDEPLADCVCIPFYFVAKLAHQNGIKVVQVGEGADELFFGYPLYARYAQVHRLWQPAQNFFPSFAKRAVWAITAHLYRNDAYPTDIARRFAAHQPLFVGGATGFGSWHKKQLLDIPHDTALYDPLIEQIIPGLPQTNDSWQLMAFHHQQLMQAVPNADFGQQMLYIELVQRLPELLLMRADKMSMATSVEAREPFLDKDLVAYLLSVPNALRFKQQTTKYLLKQVAAKWLPSAIINRPKVGFGAPTLGWLQNGSHFPAYMATLPQGPYLQPTAQTTHLTSSRDAVLAWILYQYQAFAQTVPFSTNQGVSWHQPQNTWQDL